MTTKVTISNTGFNDLVLSQSQNKVLKSGDCIEMNVWENDGKLVILEAGTPDTKKWLS